MNQEEKSRILNNIGLERGDKVTRLEAFVDAAFAFSLTLLVISGGKIPVSVEELIDSLKQLPAYAASFYLVIRFWSSHVEWSRRYGLDDLSSRRLSILLVFLVLIFVYPLKMVFSSFFNVMSMNYLPTNFVINSVAEVPALFITFSIAFGSMGLVMTFLFLHAWRVRQQLHLSDAELLETRQQIINWSIVPSIATVSILLALTIPLNNPNNFLIGMPGFIYFLINILQYFSRRYFKRKLKKLGA
jgi:uncharacterized membrane protein